MREFINREQMQQFIEAAVKHYERAPAWFITWLEDLYTRLQDDLQGINLDEVLTLSRLYDVAEWMPEPLAVNMIYKMYDRLGRDTTGIIGY